MNDITLLHFGISKDILYSKNKKKIIEYAMLNIHIAELVLFNIRWPYGFECPKCGARLDCCFKKKPNCHAHVFRCLNRHEASVISGTYWHRTRISLSLLLKCIDLIVSEPFTMTVREFQQRMHFRYETAYDIYTKIRKRCKSFIVDNDIEYKSVSVDTRKYFGIAPEQLDLIRCEIAFKDNVGNYEDSVIYLLGYDDVKHRKILMGNHYGLTVFKNKLFCYHHGKIYTRHQKATKIINKKNMVKLSYISNLYKKMNTNRERKRDIFGKLKAGVESIRETFSLNDHIEDCLICSKATSIDEFCEIVRVDLEKHFTYDFELGGMSLEGRNPYGDEYEYLYLSDEDEEYKKQIDLSRVRKVAK